MNLAVISGRLGQSPELRQTRGGTPVAKFSVATSEYRDGQEQTTWHNVTTFGKTAENCSRFLAKGSKALVQGKLETQSWEDKDTGKKMYRTEIVAFKVEFLDSRQGGGSASQGEPDNSSDDIPF